MIDITVVNRYGGPERRVAASIFKGGVLQFLTRKAVRTGAALTASLLCGAAAIAASGPASAASSSTYTIASSNELTGPVASLGEPYVSGFQTYIDTINSKGGVDGHHIRLTVLDDAASPTTGVSNTQQLLQSNPLAFLSPIASAVGDPQQNLLDKAKVPAIAYTGVEGQLTSPYYFAVGLDGTDTMNISAQFIKSIAKGKVRIGFLTIISPATVAAVAQTKKLTDSYGWTYTGQVQYDLSSPDYAASAAAVKQANPNYIIMASPDGQAQSMMAALKSQGVNVPVVNFEAGNATSTFVAADNANFYAIREFYDPSAGTAAVAPMNAAAKKYGETKNMQGLAFTKGWVAGQVLVNALKQCSGGGKTCTSAEVTSALNATSNFATGLGQNVKFSKTNHAGTRCGTIYQLKPPATSPVPASKIICSTSPQIKAATS
jgi:branched-chain amino acid transport system substrate-binding protein